MSDFNQIPTKVKFRMIQLKVGQTVSGRCFGPVLTVPFYAVKRNEPRRLTGINRAQPWKYLAYRDEPGFTGEPSHLY